MKNEKLKGEEVWYYATSNRAVARELFGKNFDKYVVLPAWEPYRGNLAGEPGYEK